MITTELIICFLLVNIIGLGCFRVLLNSNLNFNKKQQLLLSWEKSFDITKSDFSSNLISLECNKIMPVVCHGKYVLKYNNYGNDYDNNYDKQINIWRY